MTMKSEGMKTKVYAGVVTILLLTAMAGVGVLYDTKGNLMADLNNEKLAGEKLLSEKLQLDKEIAQLREELLAMGNKNNELNGLIAQKEATVKEKDASLSKLQKENNSLKGLKKEVDALKKERDLLTAEINQYKKQNQLLADANQNLESTVSELEAQNAELRDKLKNAAVLQASNFRVDVLRKNQDKLTVKARQTRVISVSFDLPKSAAASLGKSKVYMVVKGPGGVITNGEKQEKKTIIIDGVKTDITPSTTQEIDLGKGPQRLTVTYSPEEDMKQGVYHVELYTDDLFLGSSQFKLMK